MPSVHDVAAYILSKRGRMTAMKLQKLVYYSQAWSIVWDDRPMFSEPIEAWANGPVVRELYDRHRGQYWVDSWEGNLDALDSDARDTVNAVLNFYGGKSSLWLSNLTHQEDPWLQARAGIQAGASCSREISLDSMATYYSSLVEMKA